MEHHKAALSTPPPRWRPDQHRNRKAPLCDETYRTFSELSEQFFGCTICTVNDSDFMHRSYSISRYEAESDAAGPEDFDGLDEDDPDDHGLFSHFFDKGLRGMEKKKPGMRASVEEELKSLMWSTGDLFTEKGWEIEHVRSHDRFSINGREVRIFVLPPGTPLSDFSHHTRMIGLGTAQKAAHIMVHDGPLRQPLLDYLFQTGKNEHYDARGTENPVAVTGLARNLEFSVPDAALGDRIDAMKHATAQADERRMWSSKSEKERVSNGGGVNLFSDICTTLDRKPTPIDNSISVLSGGSGHYSIGQGRVHSRELSPNTHPRELSRGRGMTPMNPAGVPHSVTGRMPRSREASINQRNTITRDTSIEGRGRMRSREPNRMPDPFSLGNRREPSIGRSGGHSVSIPMPGQSVSIPMPGQSLSIPMPGPSVSIPMPGPTRVY